MTNTRELAAQLYHQLYLEVEHMKQAIAYEDATSFCSNCPMKNWDDWYPQSYSDEVWGPRIANSCCKEADDYQEIEYEHIKACEKIMETLKPFAGDEELKAAQAKVSKVQN